MWASAGQRGCVSSCAKAALIARAAISLASPSVILGWITTGSLSFLLVGLKEEFDSLSI